MFREATSTFHTAAAIGVLDATSVVVVGRGQKYKEKAIVDFVDELGQELPELGLLGGVFCNADIPTKPKSGQSELSALHAVEFARFAASDHALTANGRVTHFNHETAVRMLSEQRESGQASQGLADFETLRSLGVESARLLNWGGLLASRLQKSDQAADLFEKAATLDDSLVYKSNFATAATTAGQAERALKLLSEVENSVIDELAERHPIGYVAYTKLLARAKLEGWPLFDAERFASMAPKALAIKDGPPLATRQLIEKALLNF